jgi:TolA-binding protein
MAADFRAAATGTNATAMALVLQGDVERMAGQYAAAADFYAAAQDRERMPVRREATFIEPERKTLRGRRWREESETPPMPPRRLIPVPAPPPQGRSGDWKNFALHEAAYRASVKHLIACGDLAAARSKLAAWELEAPLSKLNGDYPLAEAEYYAAGGEWRRVVKTLQAYRKGVDMTSSLPDAMALELQGLVRLERRQEAVELAREFLKRFPAHPAADKAKRLIASGG